MFKGMYDCPESMLVSKNSIENKPGPSWSCDCLESMLVFKTETENDFEHLRHRCRSAPFLRNYGEFYRQATPKVPLGCLRIHINDYLTKAMYFNQSLVNTQG